MTSTEKNHNIEFKNEDQDIDFKDITLTLWSFRKIVTTTTLLVLVASLIYAYVKPNIYKAEALIEPASVSDIHITKITDHSFPIETNNFLSPDQVFNEFHRKISSNKNLFDFYIQKNPNTPNPKDSFQQSQIRKINIYLNKEKKELSIQLFGTDKNQLEKTIDDYILQTKKTSIIQIKNFLSTLINDSIRKTEKEIENQIQLINQKISIEKEQSKTKIETENSKYEKQKTEIRNNITIAKKLGLIDININLLGQAEKLPPYLLGVKALEAQLEVLEASPPLIEETIPSPFDDTEQPQSQELEIPTIPVNKPLQKKDVASASALLTTSVFSEQLLDAQAQLEKLQSELTLYKSVKFKDEEFQPVLVTQEAYASPTPIAPNRQKIVLTWTIIGFLLSCALVILVDKIRRTDFSAYTQQRT